LFKILQGFFRSFLPFLEVIILSFVLGIVWGSSATAIVVFLFLLVTVYLYAPIVLSVGWGVATFFILVQLIPQQTILFQLFIAIVIGGIRFTMLWFMKK
jgi:hypothetical protein